MHISSSAAVYVISVAADLAGMHPQTLRQYDRLGLVTPERTAGRGRRPQGRPEPGALVLYNRYRRG